MDLNLLRAFVAVAHEGNLTRAASQLHVTQPAVSQQIKHLQETLGVTLFSRTSHGLLLTRDGRALLPHAERALAAATDVRRAADALRHEVRGRLRIGTILDPEFLRLGIFLRTLVETYPQIEVALRHGMSGSVLEGVRTGQFDVGFYIGDPRTDGVREGAHDRAREDERFDAVRLTAFQYQVLAPTGWDERVNQKQNQKRSVLTEASTKASAGKSAAKVDGADWAALATLPWIWTPPDSAHNRLLSRVFDEAGVSPLKVAEVDQEQSMLDLVKSGIGLTLVRDSVALVQAHAHALTVAHGFTVPTQLSFVTLRERREEPVIAAALRLIERQWATRSQAVFSEI